MNIEGVELTAKTIEILKEWQDGWIDVDIKGLDDAVCFIAKTNDGCEDNELRSALTMISGLCVIKEKLVAFINERKKHENR